MEKVTLMYIPNDFTANQRTNEDLIRGMPRKLAGDYGSGVLDLADTIFEVIRIGRDNPARTVDVLEEMLVEMQQTTLLTRRLAFQEELCIPEFLIERLRERPSVKALR